MKRRVALVVVGGVLAVLVWWMRGRSEHATTDTAKPGSNGHAVSALITSRAAIDLHGAARAAIRGTVRDEHGAPVPEAKVCADAASWFLASTETDTPSCATTDAQGHYHIEHLIPADYEVGAGAPHFRMAVYEANPRTHHRAFALKAGETRDGVDLVLRGGGVEVTGSVSDIAGGPIAHAQVRASRNNNERGPVVETDAQGKFSLWIDRGTIGLAARADGYATKEMLGTAPGQFELLLTPEGSLAGRVVDAATDAPVAGARVRVVEDKRYNGDAWVDITDDGGEFHIEHLPPGRYLLGATTDHGYGVAAGSVLVGLGQHVDGVTVKLYPAHQVVAKVVVAETHAPAESCKAYLNDRSRDRVIPMRQDPEGTLVANGMLAGTYRVSMYCKQAHDRTPYPPVVVGDADVAVTWEVDAGATLRGTVRTSTGEPVEDAELFAHGVTSGATSAASAFDHSRSDGAFTLAGLIPGHYQVLVRSDRGIGPAKGFEIDIPAGAQVVDHDFVLETGGSVSGNVRDTSGAPIRNVRISIHPLDHTIMMGSNEVRVDATGAFRFDGLRSGAYQVAAERGQDPSRHEPGANGAGDRVVVRAGATATVQLVLEAEDGRITGTVRDAEGKPVSDAFVASARETDAGGARASSVAETRQTDWWGEDRPALTGSDGSFTLDHLAAGAYTVRAYRKGGGETIAEHVAVGTSVALQIKPTGSLAGTVHASGGATPETIQITARVTATGFSRSDRFYRTDGRFALSDLPAGHYELTATGDGGQGSTTVDLADGEARSGVVIELEPRVDVTGRLVEDGTEIPVPGMRMIVMPAQAGTTAIGFSDNEGAVSDAQGRFTVHDVASGKIYVRGFPLDFQNSVYAYFTAVRSVAPGSASPVELGTIGVLRARVKLGEPVGQLGLKLAPVPDDVPFEQHKLEISWIDPKGPAAASGLKVGDAITACDGKDVTGDNAARWPVLTRAPPGTKLALTTQRGPTYPVTLAAP